MADIIVNTLDDRYKKPTALRGVRGLGNPFGVLSSNSDKILVSEASIQGKLTDMRALYQEISNLSGAGLNDIDRQYGTATDEESIVFYTKEKLRGIIFKNSTVPSEATGRGAGGWFSQYSRDYDIPRKGDSRFKSRDKCARVINDWITLLSGILARTSGLAEDPPTQVVTGTDEASRTIGTYGVISVSIQNLEVPLASAILSASNTLIRLKTLQFFDADREYKTVINFGNDKQYLVESWRSVPSDSASIQLKLTNPLDGTIALYQSASIFRDIAKPVIDTADFQLLPAEDTTPFLRPLNTDVGKFNVKSQTVKDVTLTSLQLITGSSGVITGSAISYDDRTFNRWYTSDFNSSELNIDFSDYNNFVTFGSAQARLNAFVNKLNKIQSYSSSISVSSSNAGERKLALEKEYIKRNLDPYEQYLYFASQSNAYSASAYYADNGVEYNSTGSWPKDASMTPLSYENVVSWYVTQSAIAQRFDEFNPNYLVKHLPEYIQKDENSVEFITFIQMFGHVMDNLKVYVDQFSQIYSTNPAPFEDLSMDQTYEVAKSFGLNLPNAYSLESLQSLVSSLYDGEGARGFVAETWKRFLHSSVYLRKIKGTRTGVDAVLNTYGVSSPLLQVKESTYAAADNYIKSDEAVYALRVTGSVSSSIQLPFVSSSFSASSLQVRFLPDTTRRSSILSANDNTVTGNWAVELVPLTGSSVKFDAKNPSSSRGLTSYFTIEPQTKDYGRIEIVDGSLNTFVSSSYFPLFADVYTHIMLRSASQDLVIVQTDGDQILHQESCSINWGGPSIPQWNSTFIYINGTGSIKRGNFDGIVDDVRVWGENISVDNFIKQAYDPGSYYGANYSSSYTSLYVDLSFSQKYASITSSATNETPYVSASLLQNLPAIGFTTASYTRIVRTIKQFTPIVGATMFSNKKVTVAAAPTFGDNFIDSDGVQNLSATDSIKPIQDKQYVGGLEYTQFALSPTDFVNQTMLRSMGDSLDVNYLIGSPRKYQNGKYTELDEIFDFFLEYYNEEINVNDYIRFFRNATKGPTEYIQTAVPARTTLVDGVVIESPILERRKQVIQKAFRVDGRNTRLFDTFVSSSSSISNGVLLTSSINVGAYDFLALYNLQKDVFPSSSTTMSFGAPLQQWGTQRLTSSFLSDTGVGTLDAFYIATSSVGPVSSTIPTDLPVFRRGIQKVGKANISASFASSSFFDYNASSVGFLDAAIEQESSIISQTGYGRNPYLGLRQSFTSSIYRIATEQDTQTPYYAIGPTSDFNDTGATTYFHKNSGLYWFPSVLVKTKEAIFRKQNYRAKLNIPIGDLRSAAEKELASITLIDPSRLTDYPGRHELTIPLRTYTTSTPYQGVLNIANILSLFRAQGTSGLRLRLYKTQTDQANDLTRSFAIVPTLSANVLFDGLLDEYGEVFPYTLIQTDESTIYYTVDNVGASDITSNIVLNYFEYEPANLVPLGYLPRHYKFTRTNNVATLRKSYKGCRLVYCPEGCPPDVTDPNNRIGRVLPRRLKNGTLVMPDQLLESTNPITINFTPKTSAIVEDLDGNFDTNDDGSVDAPNTGQANGQ